MSLTDILSLLPDLTPGEQRLVERAYHFAEEKHRPFVRKSGEPYFVHCAAVALILAEWRLDAASVAAGLLHDVVEDTPVTIEELEAEFGGEVAVLVDGVTKIAKIGGSDKKVSEAEYLRKTLNSMSNDVRVILIKLADRLHNMRTLGSLKPERRVEIAQETMQLFAPLATRLGMWRLKADLEDLCFRYIHPEAYLDIANRVQQRQSEREQVIEQISQQLQNELARFGIKATIYGRPKNFYSIYRKMERKQNSFEDTYDVRGVRVIVDDFLDCYRVLGIVHGLWKPVGGQFDDYIAAPKDNFYQSLHTAVQHQGMPLEVQIRTWEMHHHAEFGVASHWRYKTQTTEFNQQIERRMRYLRDLIDPAQGAETASEFVRVVIENIESERVYARTPKGDVIDLPYGATPVDFAYYIHTEVGHRCRGARVNNQLVPLDTPLKSGERVEIITSNRGGPNLDWLDVNLGYIHTNRARTKIRDWFHKQGRERLIMAGRQALDRRLHQLGIEQPSETPIRTPDSTLSVDDMLVAIAQGSVSATDMAVLQIEPVTANEAKPTNGTTPIIGARGYEVRIARCCRPKPGDRIVGYITRQATVTIHRADCANLNSIENVNKRLISVDWASRPTMQVFPTPVEIRAHDRAGLMGEIGAIAAQEHINMTNVSINTQNGLATFHVTMEVDNYATLSRVLTRIQSLENVIEARRRVTA